MAETQRTVGAVRTAVVWEALREVIEMQVKVTGRDRLDILDAGGGTGGFAVPLAGLGHSVTVVDPSPDSLAALERRAAESGVTVRALQGDAADLGELLEPAGTDLVLLHSVLEYVDDPRSALAAVAGLLRPGGAVSVLAANSAAAAIHRCVTGQFEEALAILTDPEGRFGDRDPVPRRYTREGLADLLAESGFAPGAAHGVRVLSDLVGGGLVDGEPRAVSALIALEQVAATHPVLRDIATQLHLVGIR
ncbi:methyltransferase [Rhizohabitans arisaemae]|uniref:methyltransferase n=1 Tax=Rhizohabitans arisaemae TaxID=2720610 RepID=UPI0024B1B481|nr:methyltransferase [Rhizohabitans arisaemae]